LIRLPLLFVSGGVLLVLVLGVFLVAFELRYSEKIVPGVSALGIDLSGMTQDEALAALESRFNYDQEAVFTFRDADRFWQMTATELGVSFDLEATVTEAFAAGHSGDIFADLTNQARAWLGGRSVSPVVTYDQNEAVGQLLSIAETIDIAPVNASLQVEGSVVTSTPGQVGRSLDLNATLDQLNDTIISLTTGAELSLIINETPPVVWNADAAASQTRAALSGPVTLVANDEQGTPLGPWVASVEQIAPLLNIALIDNGDGTQRYEIGVDVEAFRTFLDELAPGLIVPALDARFRFNQGTRQLEVLQPSQPGRYLNVDKTLENLESGIFSPMNRTVAMAFDFVKPRFHEDLTAEQLSITEMVSEATTFYSGSSANRRGNIAKGASMLNGVVVPPGEEFSFNFYIGDISEEAGWLEGLIIFGGRTVKGVGGGICQVSTTAFRAALAGGFPIIERNSHGYRVGYYEISSVPGLDAAIFTPERDFRFQNDTPYHLLIETEFNPTLDALTFRLYSTNPGRQVVIGEPTVRNLTEALPTIYEANRDLQPGQFLQVDWAKEGADVNVKRTILDLNGNVLREDNIFTHYVPWPSVIQVAPGDARLSQST
jgi:vancomycin resistance protein YoaR